MKALSKAWIGFGISAAVLGLASLSAFADSADASLPACSSIDLRSAQVGTKCETSKGATFERVERDHFGEAWMDPNGVIWSDDLGSGTRAAAAEACRKIGAALPSGFDFKMGFGAGMAEVLPNSVEPWYWTTSMVIHLKPFIDDLFDYSRQGYIVDPRTGDLMDDLAENQNDYRCVGR